MSPALWIPVSGSNSITLVLTRILFLANRSPLKSRYGSLTTIASCRSDSISDVDLYAGTPIAAIAGLIGADPDLVPARHHHELGVEGFEPVFLGRVRIPRLLDPQHIGLSRSHRVPAQQKPPSPFVETALPDSRTRWLVRSAALLAWIFRSRVTRIWTSRTRIRPAGWPANRFRGARDLPASAGAFGVLVRSFQCLTPRPVALAAMGPNPGPGAHAQLWGDYRSANQFIGDRLDKLRVLGQLDGV